MKNTKKILSVFLAVLLVVLSLPMGIISIGAAEKTGMTGTGAEADPYVIWDIDGWVAFAKQVNVSKDNFKGKFVTLGADIDMTESATKMKGIHKNPYQWPVGGYGTSAANSTPFAGTFDGKGFTIKNYTVTNNSTGRAFGLFGYIKDATVMNLKIENCHFSTNKNNKMGNAFLVGGVADGAPSTIKNITVNNCTMNAHGNLSPIVGIVYATTNDETVIENCKVTNTTINYLPGRTDNSSEHIGGVVAKLDATAKVPRLTIKNCDVQATYSLPDATNMTALADYVYTGQTGIGGILGYSNAYSAEQRHPLVKIDNCKTEIAVAYGYGDINGDQAKNSNNASAGHKGATAGIGGIAGILTTSQNKDKSLQGGFAITNCTSNMYVALTNTDGHTVEDRPHSGAAIGGVIGINSLIQVISGGVIVDTPYLLTPEHNYVNGCTSELYVEDIDAKTSELFAIGATVGSVGSYSYYLDKQIVAFKSSGELGFADNKCLINVNGQNLEGDAIGKVGEGKNSKPEGVTIVTEFTLDNNIPQVDIIQTLGGSGTEAAPYSIKDSATWALMVNMSRTTDFAGKYIRLVEDIDLSSLAEAYAALNPASNGADYMFGYFGKETSGQKYAFKGHFDGQGHTVSNFKITATGNAGLFRYIGDGAYVGNFTLKDSAIATSGNKAGVGTIGAFACEANGVHGLSAATVEKINVVDTTFTFNKTDATKELYMGGIVGQVATDAGYSGILNVADCNVEATFNQLDGIADNTAGNTGIGGILGYVNAWGYDSREAHAVITGCKTDVEVNYGYNGIGADVADENGIYAGIGGIAGVALGNTVAIDACEGGLELNLVKGKSNITAPTNKAVYVGGIVGAMSPYRPTFGATVNNNGTPDDASDDFIVDNSVDMHINACKATLVVANGDSTKVGTKKLSDLVAIGSVIGAYGSYTNGVLAAASSVKLTGNTATATVDGAAKSDVVGLKAADAKNANLFVSAGKADYTTYSVSLNNQIVLNFYPDLSDEFKAAAAGKAWGVEFDGVAVKADANGKVSLVVAAADYEKVFKAKLVIFTDDTNYTVYADSKTYEVGVKKYAEALILKGKTVVENDLGQAIVDYIGAVKDYKADDVVLENIAEAVGESAKVEFLGTSVVFGEKTALRYYFKLNAGMTVADLIVDGGEIVADGDVYYVEFADISAKDYDEDKVAVVDGVSYTASVEDYCAAAAAGDKEALANLAKAAVALNVAADAYFN